MSSFFICFDRMDAIRCNRQFFLFLIVSLIISGFYTDLWSNGNTSARVLPIVSWIDDGTLQIDKNEALAHDKCFVNGHFYSDKAPLPVFLMIPFVQMADLLHLLPHHEGSILSPELYALCGFLGGTLPFVGILIVTLLALQRSKRDDAPLIVLLTFTGSYIFIYSGTFFGHLFAAFLLLISFVSLDRKRYLLSGLFIGLSFASEYPVGLIGLIWGVQLIFKEGWKRAFLFSVGTLPGILFIMAYNYHFTGSPFDMLYKFVPPQYDFMKDNYGMGSIGLHSVFGLSFSPYRGLLFYTPVLIPIAYFAIRKIRKKFSLLWSDYLVFPTIATFLLIASYKMWWGGWCWGPRHLVPITVLLLFKGLQLVEIQQVKRWILWLFIIAGLIINLPAKITIQYSMPTEVDNPVKEVWVNNLFKGFVNPNSIGTHPFGLSTWISCMIFFILLMVGIFLFRSAWYRRSS